MSIEFFAVILTIAFDEKVDSFSDEEMSSDSISSKIIHCTEHINKQMIPLDALSGLLKYVELPLYKRVRKDMQYLEGSVEIFLYYPNR